MTINDSSLNVKDELGYQTMSIHFGATESRLAFLEKVFRESLFDSPPATKKSRRGLNNSVEEHIYQGKIKGNPYSIFISCNECPTPVLKTQIHYMEITFPENIEIADSLIEKFIGKLMVRSAVSVRKREKQMEELLSK